MALAGALGAWFWYSGLQLAPAVGGARASGRGLLSVPSLIMVIQPRLVLLRRWPRRQQHELQKTTLFFPAISSQPFVIGGKQAGAHDGFNG